jgi:hypothetical protein
MSNKLTKLLEELHKIESKASVQALATAPLARPLPSTAGNSVFGKTSELRAVVDKIRAVEASNPSLAKFPATSFPAGNLCDKKALENAQRHLAAITATAPRKPFSALTRPTAAKAVTSPAKASTGRSAQDLLALDPDAQNRLIFAAMPLAARPLRDELRNAYASAPAGIKTKFATAFRNALHAHERDQAPSITKAQFDQLNPQQKMDSAKSGIKITN